MEELATLDGQSCSHPRYFANETLYTDDQEPVYVTGIYNEDDLQLNQEEALAVKALVKRPTKFKVFIASVFSLMVAALWVAGFIQSLYVMEELSIHSDRIAQLEDQLNKCSCLEVPLSESPIVFQTSFPSSPPSLQTGVIHSSY